VLERWQVTPAQWQWDPSLPYFGEPLYYYVHTQGSRGAHLAGLGVDAIVAAGRCDEVDHGAVSWGMS